LIILFAAVVRLLIKAKLDHSSLLYLGVPFLLAMALLTMSSREKNHNNYKTDYMNLLRDSLIVMLGSSLILYEGFLCVLMFMPIYFGVILLVFLVDSVWQSFSKTNRLSAHALPILMILMSLEGTTESLSFNRYHQVEASQIVGLSIEEIKQNLSKPIDLEQTRPWFLHLFPVPYQIDAGSLKAGDVHVIHYRYKKWFFTNIHEGTASLQIADVDDHHIKTVFLSDSSYISNYAKLLGTTIHLEPIDQEHTRVTLKISFKRKLDPAWYFAPLEKYTVTKTADYLISNIIAQQTKII
jgi:hypothetical protein